MKAFILKDIRLLKMVNIVTVIAGIFFLYVSLHVEGQLLSQLAFGYVIFLLTYVVAVSLANLEAKSKGDVVLNSLPLKRREVVKGRYVTMLLYTLGIGVFIFILGHLMSPLTIDNIMHPVMVNAIYTSTPNILTILLASAFVILFLSIYLPIQYYSIGKVQEFGGIFYIFFTFGPYFLWRYHGGFLSMNFIQRLYSLDLVLSSLIVLIFSCVLYILSYRVSVGIYHKKEF